MADKQVAALKKRVADAISAAGDEIIELGEDIFAHPELGYKEQRTSDVIAAKFKELGLEPERNLAGTGVRAVGTGRKAAARVAVIGELDAVVSPQHRHADPLTGAAHACGHHAQIANLYGVACGLMASGVLAQLDGTVDFLAVPAEEFVELGYRQRLMKEGKIDFFGGKQEFIKNGIFDGLDAVMMVHSQAQVPGRKAFVGGTSNGFVGKIINYQGRAAHAGAAPHEGINALNAAMLGLMAVHAQRETFRDQDSIRVHPIITKGGDLVNIVPAEVVVETYVRGRTMDAVFDANKKVNQALEGGAYAIGAKCNIEEIPGYLPLNDCGTLSQLFGDNMAELIGRENVVPAPHMAGSSDIGDVSQLVPTIQPSVGGFGGVAHGKDFCVTDPEMAYIIPAQALAMTVVDLLYGEAATARTIKENFRAPLTRDSYLKMWDDFRTGNL
ncbi:MAG TPA: amidohydrolase [Firmicutes bacterium]|nr:amidohydrolase [Bacillota bacterium]